MSKTKEQLIDALLASQKCEKEVIELHQFFQDWFNGELQPTDKDYARFVNVLSEDFIIIDPNGNVTQREPLLVGLRNAHNSRSEFKIWIENFQFRHFEGQYCCGHWVR